MQNEKNGREVLAKNRNQLMDLMFSSKMKRANEVKVYKEFSSVIDFIDRESNELILLDEPVDTRHEKDRPSKTTASPVNNEVGSGKVNRDQVNNSQEDASNEKGKSNYWDRRYI